MRTDLRVRLIFAYKNIAGVLAQGVIERSVDDTAVEIILDSGGQNKPYVCST